MTRSGRRSIVLLGMVTKMPVPGVLWQTLHYLEGFRRLGYDVVYVEDHARSPSTFVLDKGSGSEEAASFLHGFLSTFGFGDRWAFRALHDDGRTFGLSESELLAEYTAAELIINLHGGTRPRDEHTATGRLVYLGTDPVQLEIEIWDERPETLEFLDRHCAVFTFGENYGNPDCGLPTTDRYRFLPTRQPVVLDYWSNARELGGEYTTIANWHQPWRRISYRGETYGWSKDDEFRKVLDLPKRSGKSFELALSSISDAERTDLEQRGWKVTSASRFGCALDPYREFILGSRGEFTVAKDQNVRLRSGWFSDRSATYLAAGRPVVTQDTGFGCSLPVGEGLFAFATLDQALTAIETIERDPSSAGKAAEEIAREHFDAVVVLSRLLADLGVQGPARAHPVSPPIVEPIPRDLILEPDSRRPLKLDPETERILLDRPSPSFRPVALGAHDIHGIPTSDSPTSASVIVVTHGDLAVTRLCLESLLSSPVEVPWEVVVVDNASEDGIPEYLRILTAADSRVRVVLNGSNLGFAAACNIGARVAVGDVLVFLNNDTAVVPGWLDSLIAHLGGDVGAVNPVTNRSGTDAEIHDNPRTYGEVLDLAADRRAGRAREARASDMLAFFCLAMRRSRWEEVGPLDEGFGIGLFEDDDYSVRLKDAGLRLICAEDVFVHHFGEASFGRLVDDGRYAVLFEQNRSRFEAKWGESWRPHPRAPDARYRALVQRTIDAVSRHVSPSSIVAVISRGDEELLALGHATGWHFPRTEDGCWAGHYPADGDAVITHLEELRDAGARYLVVPATGSWWLGHYGAFREHLSRVAKTIVATDDFWLYELFPAPGPTPRPVFLIGAPRSGTSILTWALGQHSNLYPLEETVWFGCFHNGLNEAFDIGSGRDGRSQLSAMGIPRSEFFAAFGGTIDELIRRHRRWPAAAIDEGEAFASARRPGDPKARWVDGTPENSRFVHRLVELFPAARFIHVLREPDSVVRSLGRFDQAGGTRQNPSEAYESWLRNVRACIEAEETLGPERVLRVLYRDLAVYPEGLIRRCLEFVGEDFEPECLLPLSTRINSSKTSNLPRGSELEGADPRLVAEADELRAQLFGLPDRRPPNETTLMVTTKAM